MYPYPGARSTDPVRITRIRSELTIKGHRPFCCYIGTPLCDVRLEGVDDLSRFTSLLSILFQKRGLDTSCAKLLYATCPYARIGVLGPYDDTLNARGNNRLGTRWSVNMNTAWLKRHVQMRAICRSTCLG